VFDHTGRVVAAFSVAGPATRITAERLLEIARLVRATSQQISFRLGYQGGGGWEIGNREQVRR
jgi:DNA-binding IclR family transcriptional regulator